jgi:hypothetical protein
MKYALTVSFLILAVLSAKEDSSSATEGPRVVGNGGDICENRFISIRADLRSWILTGGTAGLILPKGISLAEYSQSMLQNFSAAKFNCTTDKIFIGTTEKTCKNFANDAGIPSILCNNERFMNTSQSDQYILVHHEYAGLSGFEISTDGASQYEISNQITGYLENQVVKKLVVKSEFDPSICSGPALNNIYEIIPLGVETRGDKDIAVGTFKVNTRERTCDDAGKCSDWTVVPNRVGMPYDNHIEDRGGILLKYRSGLPSLTFETVYPPNRSGYGFSMDCGNLDKFNGTCKVFANHPDLIKSASGHLSEHCAWFVMTQTDTMNPLVSRTDREIVLTGKY